MITYSQNHIRLIGKVVVPDLDGPVTTRFFIPEGSAGRYRIAQMDDYSRLPRGKFLHRPPLTFSLEARVSDDSLPGTWGFGFWNDPFALGIGIKGSGLRLPALPETAWFFYGSPKNDLSFCSDTPVNGLTAAVFSSARIPTVFLPFGLPVLPFLFVKRTARMLRRLASRFIHEECTRLDVDVTRWHSYRLDWQVDSVSFQVDDVIVQSSSLSPRPPLGLVIWIDNQYAAFSADGTIRYGTEANPVPAWMEIRNLTIESPHVD